MSFTINLGVWNSVFAVPCSVVDNNIKLAGSVQLKVLLWVLRHAGETIEAEDIAHALGIDCADVKDALLYWQETGVIVSRDNVITPSPAPEATKPVEKDVPFQPEMKTAETSPERPKRVLSRPQKPDSAFVAKRMEESEEIACLMQTAQEILGRLISSGESATLLMIHDDFGLPSDVIIMLMQYAVSIGKGNMRYIEKVAMNWADEGITTHEKAEERLRLLSEEQKAWRIVEQAIGIPHRAPSKREEEFAPIWVNQWKFSPEMIREAYDRTIDGAGKYQTAYMNSILERWYKAGIKTPKQAADERMERNTAVSGKTKGTKSEQKKQYSFDIDEYERTSIYDNMKR
ncbi:MAG: DnaD domain protein [Thermocaproicibacter melissae]|jgi:DnaD/phage-associated family protein|uniref:DnaD domain protein n=1 Tax=Thermocaproicibacter melissae TaxID=2966552 RepID=UPI003A0FBE7A